MNTKNLLPLTAAAVFALCAGSMVVSATHADNNRNTAEATHIVDLATVTVKPSAEDLAYFVAQQAVRVVDMPVVTVRPSAEDMQQIAVQAGVLAGQLASR
jgi:hypothetical protein